MQVLIIVVIKVTWNVGIIRTSVLKLCICVKLLVKISQSLFVCVLVVVEKALTQAEDGSPGQFKEGRLDLNSYYSKRFVQVSPFSFFHYTTNS